MLPLEAVAAFLLSKFQGKIKFMVVGFPLLPLFSMGTGCNSRWWGGFPAAGGGGGLSAWTHLANGEGHCPPPCGPDTEH